MSVRVDGTLLDENTLISNVRKRSSPDITAVCNLVDVVQPQMNSVIISNVNSLNSFLNLLLDGNFSEVVSLSIFCECCLFF